MHETINIIWFRRDLRLFDNAALYHALKSNRPVLPLFIFDTNILDELENKSDARVTFIYKALEQMHAELKKLNSGMKIFHGNPVEIWKQIISEYKIEKVFTNHDYEPYAQKRDAEIENLLKRKNISFYTFKDQVIFERDEVMKDDGSPYTVFTPYSKKWKAKLNDFYLQSYPCEKYFYNWVKYNADDFPKIETMGFQFSSLSFPDKNVSDELLEHYAELRNIPGVNGTSKLSVHLRFGTISIRQLARQAQQHSIKYFDELIWREFYQMILWNFPHVVGKAFKREYDNIPWSHNEEQFEKWREGKTGFPIVDAGMRELNATGYMHNRVRMIVAGFLTKHLLIDWRWGEAYFAEKLLDFELASNNGGWQWAAGTGVDAAPYFRIFNPTEQVKKFDPDLVYIRKWIPELDSLDYPQPMVDHVKARQRALDVYKKYTGNKFEGTTV
jgi:deoxyribodipyrimidine photo-lyase